jgi:hypothetical protein
MQGRIQARTPPPKIGKNMIFWHKIVIFHTKYPQKNLSAPPPNLKSWIRLCNVPSDGFSVLSFMVTEGCDMSFVVS